MIVCVSGSGSLSFLRFGKFISTFFNYSNRFLRNADFLKFFSLLIVISSHFAFLIPYLRFDGRIYTSVIFLLTLSVPRFIFLSFGCATLSDLLSIFRFTCDLNYSQFHEFIIILTERSDWKFLLVFAFDCFFVFFFFNFNSVLSSFPLLIYSACL